MPCSVLTCMRRAHLQIKGDEAVTLQGLSNVFSKHLLLSLNREARRKRRELLVSENRDCCTVLSQRDKVDLGRGR